MKTSTASAAHKRGLKTRLWANVLRTHPFIVLRIALTWVVMLPWFLIMVMGSSFKASRWSRLKTCRNFMKKNELAFSEIDPDSIQIESLSGGLSNSNHLWRCKRKDGSNVTFFVKVFVAIGTFWARNLSLVSPFPEVYGISTRERFAVDIVSRVLLAERGIAVPGLVAFDAVEQVLVTNYLEGKNVDEILRHAGQEEKIQEETETVIRLCAGGLGKIHRLGYSLIDTQPINCIWSAEDHRVYFTDLEFCTRRDKRLWDVAFFMCFLSIRLPGELKMKAHKIFLTEYEKESGLNRAELDKIHARLDEYIPIFRTVLDLRQFKPEELLAELANPAG